jgi:thioredoxin-dependent peroxiredoxin
LIRIATGTSDILPLAVTCSTPTARGPSSFFRAALRSPVMICGRCSCAKLAVPGNTNPAVTAAASKPRYRIKIARFDNGSACPELNFLCENAMNLNDKAPDFTLQDENGKEIALKNLRGKTVILFFYPKADTPGCTIEACEFRDSYKKMQKTGAVLLGISPDTPKDQKKFADKFSLPFTLLADADKKVAEAFGVVKDKNMYGKKVRGVARTTFVIGPEGKIQHIFEKVKPEGHAEEVLAYLKESPAA